MSKEKILWSFPQGESEPYGHPPIHRIYEAMDKYAATVIDWVAEQGYDFSIAPKGGLYGEEIIEEYNKYISNQPE